MPRISRPVQYPLHSSKALLRIISLINRSFEVNNSLATRITIRSHHVAVFWLLFFHNTSSLPYDSRFDERGLLSLRTKPPRLSLLLFLELINIFRFDCMTILLFCYVKRKFIEDVLQYLKDHISNLILLMSVSNRVYIKPFP